MKKLWEWILSKLKIYKEKGVAELDEKWKQIDAAITPSSGGTNTGESAETTVDPSAPTAEASSEDEGFAALKWVYGGFNGANAKLGEPRISNLKVSANKLSFHWDVGMKSWGLADDDAGAICAVFFEDASGAKRGGKFDWISVTRSNRELKHCTGVGAEPYKNWSVADFPNPCRCWFVVVRRDGKERSNVLEGKWSR